MYPKSQSWAFARAVLSSFVKPIWFGIVFLAVELACFVLQIFFTSKIVKFLQEYESGTSDDVNTAYLYAMALSLATLGLVSVSISMLISLAMQSGFRSSYCLLRALSSLFPCKIDHYRRHLSQDAASQQARHLPSFDRQDHHHDFIRL